MFDAALRPWIDRCLDPVGRGLARMGVSANAVSWFGFASDCGCHGRSLRGAADAALLILETGCVTASTERWRGLVGPATLGPISISRLISSSTARCHWLAVADPGHALAAAFLIFSFVGTGSSFLAFAIIAQKRGISTEVRGKKGFFYLGGLTEGGETIIFLLVAVLYPQVFVPLAWIFGLLCWVTTCTRVWSAITRFGDS